MRDEDCVSFLQAVLPHLHLRWPGFRKVRGQVCKRLHRRLHELALENVKAYRQYLAVHAAEWQILDALCRVSISRFYRDKQMFAFLEHTVLPELARQAVARKDDALRVWCIGAGSGEEPYTLAILWQLQLQQQFPGLRLQILASEADPTLLQRCALACYDYSSVKNLPSRWRDNVFAIREEKYCLQPEFQAKVRFIQHDVRDAFAGVVAAGSIDLLLCRNLVFTYFDAPLQQQTLRRCLKVIRPGGALVIGIHEQLPEEVKEIKVWSDRLRIFCKR